jgi:hypothetical protein
VCVCVRLVVVVQEFVKMFKGGDKDHKSDKDGSKSESSPTKKSQATKTTKVLDQVGCCIYNDA